MSEIEIEEYSLDIEDPAAPPASIQAASQATSASQDPPTEPVAALQGRRPSRATAAHTSRRRISPSPPPSKRQPSSPASSYASALSSAPPKGKWTVVGLRQALASSGVFIPRRSTKADLFDLYASPQAGENLNSTPPSRASGRACTATALPTHGPSKPPLLRGRLLGRQDAAIGSQRAWATPPRPRPPATALLLDHPSGSSSPPQAALVARARPHRRKNPARSFCPAILPTPSPTHGPQHRRPIIVRAFPR
ncbi:translation initiation factor IF-2-like protein [Labeo rohita]|uniref:Translation initiation factor IF-2-like protein n=1 Tax=Labeo rohita TaxID=84645 RepID=A0A498MDV1_LABRO|nr:translation initiation factor IF-2-like protein [Labeo rohita]RXN36929.1 translation initiation factor IF-2-like protein [Labeo rohita]